MHLTPEYVLRHWTEEELALFLQKWSERKYARPRPDDGQAPAYAEREPRYVSNHEFFTAPIGKGLPNPNAQCFKRVPVMK